MSQEMLVIPSPIITVDHSALKLKIMITGGGGGSVPGHIKDPGGTAGVIIPT